MRRSFDYGTKWYNIIHWNLGSDYPREPKHVFKLNFIHTIYRCLLGESPLFWALVLICHMMSYVFIYIYMHTWIFQVFLRPASNHRGKTYHIISDFRKRIWFQIKHLSLLGLHLKWKGYYTSGLGSKPEVVLNVSRIGESPKLCLQNSAKRQPHPISTIILLCIYIYICWHIYIYVYSVFKTWKLITWKSGLSLWPCRNRAWINASKAMIAPDPVSVKTCDGWGVAPTQISGFSGQPS